MKEMNKYIIGDMVWDMRGLKTVGFGRIEG